MSRKLLLLGTLLVFGASGAALGALPASGAPLGGGPKLIDTSIVVGFPQHAAATGFSVAPEIFQQPQSTTVASGTKVSFSSQAFGLPNPTIQWQDYSSTNPVWTNIAGAQSTSYSFTATSAQNGEQFRAVFSNSAGTVNSSAATLTVTGGSSGTAPSITTQPTSQTVASGNQASFTAAASGNPTPTVQWYSSPNDSTWTIINGATSGTYSFQATTTQNGYYYRAVFTNTVSTATTNAAQLTVTSSTPPPSQFQSSNWSGYADTGGPYTSVAASWTVPTVTCSGKSSAYSAEWIGIDGYSSSTVEQDGTEADCVSGSPTYDAWYEMYGDNSVNSGYEVELSPQQYPVSPGDSVSASVHASGTSWTLTIADSSKGWSYSTPTITFRAAESSAEWIVERPELCGSSCSLTALANFGSVSFSNASTGTSTSSGTISAYPDASIEMVNGSTPLAVPGSLDPTGASFTDTWEAAGSNSFNFSF